MQFASTIKNRTSQNTTKVFNRACKADPKEKLFLKNFQRFKKNKNTPTHSLTSTADNDTKTQYRLGLQRHCGQKASR